jgi:hypothetical protein
VKADFPPSQVNIDCLYYKASIAPNQKILNDLKPSKEQVEKIDGAIMKEVNDLRLQIASKNTLSAIDHQDKTFNTSSPRSKSLSLNIE